LVLFSPAKLVEAFPARGSSSLVQDCNTILETYWQQSWMSFLMLLGWFDVIMEISDLVPRETAFQSGDADEHGSIPRFVFRALPVPWHELNSILMGSGNDVTNALLKSNFPQAMTSVHANSMMGYPNPPSHFLYAQNLGETPCHLRCKNASLPKTTRNCLSKPLF
jgi:hypothetical protein